MGKFFAKWAKQRWAIYPAFEDYLHSYFAFRFVFGLGFCFASGLIFSRSDTTSLNFSGERESFARFMGRVYHNHLGPTVDAGASLAF
jgi:hypothetical protein